MRAPASQTERDGMKRLLAAAAVGIMIGGSAVSTAAQAAPDRRPKPDQVSYTPPPIEWGECERPALQARNAQCGFVVVPLDYSRPGGTKIRLAVSRVRHSTPDSQYQGIMLVNPGGPGGSGLIYSVLGEFIPDGAGASYDWIGFDPRGVGSSEPALTCDSTYAGYNRPPYVPTTRAIEREWLDRAREYAEACDAAGGELLDHMKTTDTVKDMDSIRKALGERQLNFYGFSYGTYLGQVYATLFPQRVRRMVFDGIVDPRGVWYQANLQQDIAFDRNIGVFFDWVAKYDSVYHLGDTGEEVERTYYAQLRALQTSPADGVIGPAELTDIFTQAGYYVFGWEDVASAFAAWVNDGDPAPLRALYDDANPQTPGSDNGYAVYLAVQCTDVQWPTSWNQWRRDNWRLHREVPFLTWADAWFNAPCLFWGARAGRPVEVNGAKAPPILLISETFDAATPYEGALEVRSRFPRSVLIEGVGGTTHSGSLSGIACTDNAIAAYLATGALPARQPGRRSDVQCDPVPQPDPTATAGPSTFSAPSAPAGDVVTRRDLQPPARR